MKRLLPLLALLLAQPAQADRLFTSGFEENNLLETMWNTVTGSPVIVTTPVHSGTYVLRVLQPAAAFANRHLSVAVTSGTHFHRFYFQVAVFPSSSLGTMFVIDNTGGSQSANVIVRDAGGGNFRIRLRNGATGGTTDSTFNLVLNTQYRIELRHLIDNTAGDLELRFYIGDSTTEEFILSFLNQDTLSTSVERFRYGFVSDTLIDLFLDDIAINDDVGTFEISFPGPGKIFLLKPNGDNTITWTKDGSAPAATNFEGVDDVPGTPNDDTDYNSQTSNSTDKLDLSNLGAEVPSDADIILADVYGRQGSDGTAGTRVIDFELWDEADSQNTLLDISADINGWKICDTDEHLVFDAGARTKANIDAFRVGYSRSIGGSNEIRITAQWVNVEWIEAAAAADIMVIQ